ncbi:hypothetical protein IEQ34_021512 [Dendrobium chrysotoxum]|uniref:Uncharacterized protein n=1 Tax=Dendrobium chrysotoxum TaxID=161865 RepID=A0AAV7G3W0_DENCH|nr:hypothetical protein IEQ34_021512 [Dendrobium chrysotoxum]
MASSSLNIHSTLVRPLKFSSQSQPIGYYRFETAKSISSIAHRIILCSTLQESSTATVSDKKEADKAVAAAENPVVAPVKKEAPAKPKKAPVKPLPEMMEEDVIPSLRATLEAQEDISQIEISFQENRLEGSFLKKDKPYYFWAFFPDGVLTGPKGFSISSYGSRVSTVEPFLIDERKITDKHVVFWVRKRLVAQGILPVWKEE